jgi:hypothetical protein
MRSKMREACTLAVRTVAPLPPKINAPQHDPRRGALELGRLILAFHAGFDALAQAHELSFALGGSGAHARR